MCYTEYFIRALLQTFYKKLAERNKYDARQDLHHIVLVHSFIKKW